MRFENPTRIHTDLADAANIMLFTAPLNQKETEELKDMVGYDFEVTTRDAGSKREPGSVWHIFHREVYEDLVRLVYQCFNLCEMLCK